MVDYADGAARCPCIDAYGRRNILSVSPSALQVADGIRSFATRPVNLGSTSLGGFIETFVRKDALVRLLGDLSH